MLKIHTEKLGSNYMPIGRSLSNVVCPLWRGLAICQAHSIGFLKTMQTFHFRAMTYQLIASRSGVEIYYGKSPPGGLRLLSERLHTARYS